VVVRTCGLYGTAGSRSRGGNFVDKRIEEGKKTHRVEMSCEQSGSPTSTEDLGRAIWRLLEAPGLQAGLYHLVNEGSCTWYSFTQAIYRGIGLAVEVVPVDRGGMDHGMRRPLATGLANFKARALGVTLPPWQEALARYLKGRHG
jgi:dTDP-4-dehydrorhamnose reductase